MTTIPQLERDVLYYKNRYERIRNERDAMKNKFDELMTNSEKLIKQPHYT